MRTTTLQSSKATSRLWKLFAALLLVWILVPIGQASAQNKATENNGTENTIGGVDNLYGIDPSSAICTSIGTAETNGDKIVCLYNVGAKKFLSIGGKWGTHASLNVSPHSIYMIWNSGSQTYFLQSKVTGSGTGSWMGIFKDKDGENGVFMDRKENCAITFEKAKDYSEKNKVYLVKINTATRPITQLGYFTAYPNDENKLCNYETSLATGTPEYKNQEWKVITKNEYYLLFHTAPAYMESAVDASFLITCPDFRIHDTGAANWKIGGVNPTTDVNSHVRFGDEKMYKTYDKVSNTKDEGFTGRTEAHQQKYGKLFYCYTKGLRGFNIYQDVTVHKAGWYLLRCNGFSTANSSENITKNGKPLANMFITVLDANKNPIKEIYSAATLDGISQDDAYQLAQTHKGKNYEGAGIGHAFFEGEYENQVQICLDKAPNGSGNQRTMVCKGTLAKTYDNDGIIDGRDDLNGDFFMYKGNLIQVPSGAKENGELYQYGLKAFRCWFELSSNTTSGSKVSLMIDGIEDSATSIDDIHADADHTSYKRGVEGVFNMNGQMVRRDNSLEGLPKGMYVVNGKKVIIK